MAGDVDTHYRQWFDKWGIVRVEEWPEGLVLWVGGKIVWKSWKK